MQIGFIGLGKLGLPTALAIEARGHQVVGWDPDPAVAEILRSRRPPCEEDGVPDLLRASSLALRPLPEVVANSELLFVTIQTPHAPRFEGISQLPAERRDFDYSFLVDGMREVSDAVEATGEDRVVVVVSTVLPGTLRRELRPLLSPRVRLVYNPFFIAMGTVIPDFLNPEFVLLGVDDDAAAEAIEGLYRTIHDRPVYRTSLENAELIKVLYNTFISTKIAFANTAMELCHRLPGTDVDAVMGALKLGGDRIISTAYLDGGMGDGGGCHPRDNIALSHLSRRLGMSFDWFENIMLQREHQTGWLADLVVRHAGGRSICVLGRAFKPGCSIETGSPSRLLLHLLEARGVSAASWDPYLDPAQDRPTEGPRCYVIGTRHPEFAGFPFPEGSVVVDPWRYIPPRPGVRIIAVGRNDQGTP